MKKIILLFLAVTMIAVVGCKDACKNVNCLNGGTCADGTCNCAEYYEGTNCENAWNVKFAGDWVGTIEGIIDPITCTITAADKPNLINFNADINIVLPSMTLSLPISGENFVLTTTNTFTIPQMPVEIEGFEGLEVIGNGSLVNGTLTVTITPLLNGTSIGMNYVFVGTKQ
ncbi:MAG: calcium-binding EGF-like domain-containing protein [Bacteroidales bacterium]|jgi:hypothetical protein|nr:calcium-binding EGF-like domain-containing protein [Bacteroidales bacterium]MDD2204950.1 calcium-binding EGF-like domain-containing protein [Bacteroidales bacterium]MDD3152173.1 calcium-binding EGF-like domain-containing protein [Bacteroidales bacterium]MDD3913891.1 calcium-binding EGF-like domain-containing protein [Bacteroidales bacterium]MDD4634269.1 calcium-binding EGF-like domain-containing protein [Bacteroidales bacterium]